MQLVFSSANMHSHGVKKNLGKEQGRACYLWPRTAVNVCQEGSGCVCARGRGGGGGGVSLLYHSQQMFFPCHCGHKPHPSASIRFTQSYIIRQWSKPSCPRTLNPHPYAMPACRASIPVFTCMLSIVFEQKVPGRGEAASLIVLTLGVMIAMWRNSAAGSPLAICLCLAGEHTQYGWTGGG